MPIGSSAVGKLSYETCFLNDGSFTDVFELCGGTARVSLMLATRKHITRGPNVDILVGVDLLDHEDIHKLWVYDTTCKPACGVIATPCTGLHAFSGINRLLHWHSWMDRRDVYIPLG